MNSAINTVTNTAINTTTEQRAEGAQLIKMANQIGQFFEANGAPEEMGQQALAHIEAFWAPMMRAQMKTLLQAGHVQGLSPFMQAAFMRAGWDKP